jgi:formylglycine-generating enzyme required for sulfatase activity
MALFLMLVLVVAGCSNVPKIVPVSSGDMVAVPAGIFKQVEGNSNFNHTISAFKIGKYEVTYDLWYSVSKWALANGYNFTYLGREGNSGIPGAITTTAKYEPATVFSWRDIIVWCNAYSEKSGLKPVYCADPAFKKPIRDSRFGKFGNIIDTARGSFDNPFVNWGADGYRLPTDGEWQYAASYKDGKTWTPLNYASGAAADCSHKDAINEVAWYSENSNRRIHPAGGKKPNALGIYDMSGNVWEWCFDWYAPYPKEAVDYRGPASGTGRIVRGGCYGGPTEYIEVGFRSKLSPFDASHPEIGFRLAKSS